MKRIMIIVLALLLFVPSIIKAGEIHVYDDDDQDLGILLTSNSDYEEIFIPSLNITARIDLLTGDLNEEPLRFSEYNCTGSGATFCYIAGLFKSPGFGYFMGTLQEISITTYSELKSGGCENGSMTMNLNVADPFNISSLPFTLPVALPLRYEYVSDTPSVPAFSNLGLAILVSGLFIAGLFVMRKQKNN